MTVRRSTVPPRAAAGLGRALATTIALAISVAACGGSDADGAENRSGGRIRVGAAFAPIEEILTEVGGDRVDVLRLTPPGSEAHDTQLTAKLLEELSDSAAVVYLGQGFQASVEDGITALDDSVARLDLLDGLTLLDGGQSPAAGDQAVEGGLANGKDPHVWLSPTNMIAMTESVVSLLVEIDPTNGEIYRTNAAGYAGRLVDLDTQMAGTLADCSTTTFVTSHDAFGYLADRYGLTQLAIAGLSPDEEPSAQQLEEIAATARDVGVSTIFVEANANSDLGEAVARELGLTTSTLETVESLSSEQVDAGITYIGAQQANLSALADALDCAA